jgi:hypothetical protein
VNWIFICVAEGLGVELVHKTSMEEIFKC